MKKSNIKRICARLLFAAYLMILLFFVFGSDRMESSEYHYNLVLFDEISRFIKYRDVVGNRVFLMNVAGNFVGFIPFGFLLPMLSRHKYNFIFVTLLSFELSLCIEVIQLVTRLGSFDVDDLLLNTLGGSVGYIIYKICRSIHIKFTGRTKGQS